MSAVILLEIRTRVQLWVNNRTLEGMSRVHIEENFLKYRLFQENTWKRLKR